ncbi:MAG: hypothetical protein WA709_34985 [Stellaceae bacterium]
MMRLTQLSPVAAAGRPAANLALTGVEIAELVDQITVATNHFRHQVAAALFCDPSRFIADEPSHRVFVARQQ